jgi:hypothetical protein
MPKFNQYETAAKAWATSHVVAALLFTAVLFFILGATLT